MKCYIRQIETHLSAYAEGLIATNNQMGSLLQVLIAKHTFLTENGLCIMWLISHAH